MVKVEQTLRQKFEKPVGQSVNKDRVTACLQRLELIQGLLENHIGEPIIYTFAFLDKKEQAWVPRHHHIAAGLIKNTELQPRGLLQVDVPAQGLAYSTLYDNKSVEGYLGTDSFTLQIGSLATMRVNGDQQSPIGLLIGSEATSEFLQTVHRDQADFIAHNLHLRPLTLK